MNRKAYNQSVLAHSDALYSYVLKMTRRKDEAQDIVQDVFTKLWQKRDTVRVDDAKAYLFKMCYNATIDHFRKAKRRKVHESAVMIDTYQMHDNLSTKDMLEQSLDRLSEEQKTIILLREQEGYSYEEISEILQLSLSQVKIKIFRARKKLVLIKEQIHKI